MGISIIKLKPIVWFIWSIVVMLGFQACYQITPVQIEVVKPAKIEIPNNISKVSVLNASVPKYKVPITNNAQANLFKLDSTVTSELVSGVSSILSESPRFTDVILHNKLYHKDGNSYLKPIKWNDLEQIGYQNQTESIVSLEAFSIKDTSITFSSLTPDGYVYENSVLLICKSLWRIYDLNKKQLVKQWLQQDSIYLDEFGTTKYFRSKLDKEYIRKWTAELITSESAHKISNIIAPYWITVRRDVFLTLNQDMQIASMLAADNKWKQAASIWKRFVDNEDEKIAAKACHNMALACEVEGRLDIALIWLQKALSLNSFYSTLNYKKIIEYRLMEQEILDIQFGNN